MATASGNNLYRCQDPRGLAVWVLERGGNFFYSNETVFVSQKAQPVPEQFLVKFQQIHVFEPIKVAKGEWIAQEMLRDRLTKSFYASERTPATEVSTSNPKES
jgi:hypothetical protein